METFFIINQLEQAWNDDGFLGKLRQGIYDQEKHGRLLDILRVIPDNNTGDLDQRIVRLIWFIPLFITWQQERLMSSGVSKQAYDEAFHQILNQIYRILGIP